MNRIRSFPPAGALLAATLVLATPTHAQLARPNAAGVAWGHLHLNVTDVERHTRIWVEHFGGRVVDLELVRTISLPGTVIMLNERSPSGGTRGSTVDHFGFSVPDLSGFLERWRADGLEVESEFEGFGGTPQAYLFLPDGIRVELQEIPSLAVAAEPYHIHLYTEGGAESLRDWYAELFSLPPRPRGRIPFTADAPGMNVSFADAGAEGVEPTRGRAVDHIGFEVENLEAFTRALAGRGWSSTWSTGRSKGWTWRSPSSPTRREPSSS